MGLLSVVLGSLDETAVAKALGPHDDARNNYRLQSVMVEDPVTIQRIVNDYYAHHMRAAPVVNPGVQDGVDLVSRLYDPHDPAHGLRVAISNGQRGKMYEMLNHMCEYLKTRGEEEYVESMLRTHVKTPQDQAAIVREIFEIKELVPHYADPSRPQDYVADWKKLVLGLSLWRRETSRIFRSL